MSGAGGGRLSRWLRRSARFAGVGRASVRRRAGARPRPPPAGTSRRGRLRAGPGAPACHSGSGGLHGRLRRDAGGRAGVGRGVFRYRGSRDRTSRHGWPRAITRLAGGRSALRFSQDAGRMGRLRRGAGRRRGQPRGKGVCRGANHWTHEQKFGRPPKRPRCAIRQPNKKEFCASRPDTSIRCWLSTPVCWASSHGRRHGWWWW